CRGFGLTPFPETRQIADPLAGEAQPGVLTETHRLHGAMHGRAAHVEGDLAHADVARLEQDAGQVQYTTGGAGHVTDGVAADLQRAGVDVDFVDRKSVV